MDQVLFLILSIRTLINWLANPKLPNDQKHLRQVYTHSFFVFTAIIPYVITIHK
jgi:hypothetical protein